MKKSPTLIAILNNIRSRENVGSIFRTADATGVLKLFLCGITPRPPHEKISKTALGAENFIEWEYQKQISRVIKNLKDKGFYIIALETKNKAGNIFKTTIKKKNIALVVGSEVKGISKEIIKKADKILKIPMRGKKESLNVAVAFGVAVYALLKI
ncbi:TrmH family RNA methyltransferase [Candidatus Parcubacteria bacterium]|nr:MAG: TrmH family RNA methyltransferase [Candidatus Parcubacteria bacterium]